MPWPRYASLQEKLNVKKLPQNYVYFKLSILRKFVSEELNKIEGIPVLLYLVCLKQYNYKTQHQPPLMRNLKYQHLSYLSLIYERTNKAYWGLLKEGNLLHPFFSVQKLRLNPEHTLQDICKTSKVIVIRYVLIKKHLELYQKYCECQYKTFINW